MAFRQIAEVTFESDVKTHPQAVIEEFDFKAPKWHKELRAYTKDDELIRYTLQKIDKTLFVLTIEQLDLFSIEPGKWREEQHPEWEALIKESLEEIKRGLNGNIRIIEIKREVI